MATALITGSAKRIGRALALDLAARGFNIIIHYNTSKEEALQTAEDIKQYGIRCSAIQADLTDSEQRNHLISTALTLYPDCNTLINNASLFLQDSFTTTTEAHFDEHIDIHVKTPYFLAQKFAKYCKKGNIINMIDSMITRNDSEHFSYLLSKKTLINLNEMLAKNLAPNIRVNCIAPNIIKEFCDEVAPKTKAELQQRTALNQLTSIEDVHKTIHYILDTHSITGQCFYLNSGEHLS